MLHYIHVQGKEAPSFYFRDKTAQHFKSLIQSLGDGSSLVISSLYRTDVFYLADVPHTEEIIKLWSLQEEKFDPAKLRIVEGRDESLEQFFTTLVLFSNMSKWYETYLSEFRNACSMDRNNPILKDLKLCEQFLQQSHQTVARPSDNTGTESLLPQEEVFEDLVKHINDFLN